MYICISYIEHFLFVLYMSFAYSKTIGLVSLLCSVMFMHGSDRGPGVKYRTGSTRLFVEIQLRGMNAKTCIYGEIILSTSTAICTIEMRNDAAEFAQPYRLHSHQGLFPSHQQGDSRCCFHLALDNGKDRVGRDGELHGGSLEHDTIFRCGQRHGVSAM